MVHGGRGVDNTRIGLMLFLAALDMTVSQESGQILHHLDGY